MLQKIMDMFKPKCYNCGKRANLDSQGQCIKCYSEYIQWKIQLGKI